MPQRVLVVALLVVAALAAALITGELYARHATKSCVAEQFKKEIGADVRVQLSPKPMLLQFVQQHVSYVDIDSDMGNFGPARGIKIHARANDIRFDDNAGSIGSSSADVEWSTSGILQTLQEQPFGALVAGVTTNPADGTLRFDVGPMGMAQLVVKPYPRNGMIQVDTMQAMVFGLGLPTDLVDGIVKTLSESLQVYPLGMTPQSLHVTDTGISMQLAGQRFEARDSNLEFGSCG